MAEVYVVTSGEYSDYGIMAVFSSEKKALDFCAKRNANRYHGDYRLETYTLDEECEQAAPPGRVYVFKATVWDRRKEKDSYGPCYVVEDEPTAYIDVDVPDCEVLLNDGLNNYGNTVYTLEVRGRDLTRVRKVYGEQLGRLKAEIEGVA
jgi:hypothetical protein